MYGSYRFAALFIFQSLPPNNAHNCQLIRFMNYDTWSPPYFLPFTNEYLLLKILNVSYILASPVVACCLIQSPINNTVMSHRYARSQR